MTSNGTWPDRQRPATFSQGVSRPTYARLPSLRSAAGLPPIRQLVLQAPAPVIAKALRYHDKTATRLVTEAGGTWSRYAPGDHRR